MHSVSLSQIQAARSGPLKDVAIVRDRDLADEEDES